MTDAGANSTLKVSTVGWLDAEETWTPSETIETGSFLFHITGDKTGKYSAGMKVKFTQTTVRYFIITKVDYVGPHTEVLMYGGTNYNMAYPDAISANYYSSQKAPFGFPLEPDKWTVQASLTADAEQLSPSGTVWYNLGSFFLRVPIGSWNLSYQAVGRITKPASVNLHYRATLSKVNNASDDNELTTTSFMEVTTYAVTMYAFLARHKYVTCTTGTTYYLLALTTTPSATSIRFRGGASYGDSIIRAVCAYL